MSSGRQPRNPFQSSLRVAKKNTENDLVNPALDKRWRRIGGGVADGWWHWISGGAGSPRPLYNGEFDFLNLFSSDLSPVLKTSITIHKKSQQIIGSIGSARPPRRPGPSARICGWPRSSLVVHYLAPSNPQYYEYHGQTLPYSELQIDCLYKLPDACLLASSYQQGVQTNLQGFPVSSPHRILRKQAEHALHGPEIIIRCAR